MQRKKVSVQTIPEKSGELDSGLVVFKKIKEWDKIDSAPADYYAAVSHEGCKLRLLTLEGGEDRLARLQNNLDQTFPWLARMTAWVLQTIRGRLYFSKDSPPIISLPPILLAGQPGIGKTEWAAQLASELSLPCAVFCVGGTPVGVEFVVSFGRSWKSPRLSRTLAFVAERQVANPLVVLDEIDKQTRDERYGEIQQALLPYLDRNASHLYDDFLCGHVDVSRINLIATANDLSKIGAPLMSRFEVLEAGRPGPEHAGVVLAGAKRRFAQDMGVEEGQVPDFPELLVAVEDLLKNKVDLRYTYRVVRAIIIEKVAGPKSVVREKEKAEPHDRGGYGYGGYL